MSNFEFLNNVQDANLLGILDGIRKKLSMACTTLSRSGGYNFPQTGLAADFNKFLGQLYEKERRIRREVKATGAQGFKPVVYKNSVMSRVNAFSKEVSHAIYTLNEHVRLCRFQR